MQESLRLFQETCNNKWFGSTPVVLFLNKSDLFREKLPKVDLRIAFPDYKGSTNSKIGNNYFLGGLDDFQGACDFIRDKFFAVVENTQRPLYCHVTCATDTKSVEAVFNAVTDIILRDVFEKVQLGV